MHSSGIQIGNLEVSGGTYGITCRYSLDEMVIDKLVTTNVYRSLFTVGVSNVTANVDSADIAGSHDVIFAAQEGWNVENCHVNYTHNRDSGKGKTSGSWGVEWSFRTLGPEGPSKILHASTNLNVRLQSTKTLAVVCDVSKYKTVDYSPDEADRGYELRDFSVSGHVDLGATPGALGFLLGPEGGWGPGEIASDVTISNLTVSNAAPGQRPVVFELRRVSQPPGIHKNSASSLVP